jgi:hypothetical protein
MTNGMDHYETFSGPGLSREEFHKLKSLQLRAKNMVFFIDHFQPARDNIKKLLEQLQDENELIAEGLTELWGEEE